jgi:hypothetical protein
MKEVVTSLYFIQLSITQKPKWHAWLVNVKFSTRILLITPAPKRTRTHFYSSGQDIAILSVSISYKQEYTIHFYHALVLVERVKLHWLDKYLLYCHRPKYSFSWHPCHMFFVELWETGCKSSSLPVDRKY